MVAKSTLVGGCRETNAGRTDELVGGSTSEIDWGATHLFHFFNHRSRRETEEEANDLYERFLRTWNCAYFAEHWPSSSIQLTGTNEGKVKWIGVTLLFHYGNRRTKNDERHSSLKFPSIEQCKNEIDLSVRKTKMSKKSVQIFLMKCIEEIVESVVCIS